MKTLRVVLLLLVAAAAHSQTSYDMLSWMLMSPTYSGSNHFTGTKLDGVTASNHVYTQQNAGNFFWTKGDKGYPWDIQLFDNNFIYLSTTEYSWTDAHTGKRFESLNPAIGMKGVPFAKRQMSIGDSVLSSDSRFGIYTACGVATYTNLGNTQVTLTGPYGETISGTGSTLPPNLTTLHLEYEWSLGPGYTHQLGSVKETYTFAQPYGLVHWQTQNWDTGTAVYDAPTAATNYNILTPGVTGVPAYDPCGFGVSGINGPAAPTGLTAVVD